MDVSKKVDEPAAAQIPDDFPKPRLGGAVGGAQPKVLLTRSVDGRYHAPGCSPEELFVRWDACEDLARQFVPKCLESKTGKRAHMSELEILDQYLTRLIATHWRTAAESKWVIRRAATLLGWPVPPSARLSDEDNGPL